MLTTPDERDLTFMTSTAADSSPPAADPRQGWKRVLLKLSGEVFGGGEVGVDPDIVSTIARQIAEVARSGVQVAVVVGGGNFFRGEELSHRGMDRARADYMGILGTVMNCLALQDFWRSRASRPGCQTAITMGQVAEPYIPRKAIRHLERRPDRDLRAGAGIRTSPRTRSPPSRRWRSARTWS